MRRLPVDFCVTHRKCQSAFLRLKYSFPSSQFIDLDLCESPKRRPVPYDKTPTEFYKDDEYYPVPQVVNEEESPQDDCQFREPGRDYVYAAATQAPDTPVLIGDGKCHLNAF